MNKLEITKDNAEDLAQLTPEALLDRVETPLSRVWRGRPGYVRTEGRAPEVGRKLEGKGYQNLLAQLESGEVLVADCTRWNRHHDGPFSTHFSVHIHDQNKLWSLTIDADPGVSVSGYYGVDAGQLSSR